MELYKGLIVGFFILSLLIYLAVYFAERKDFNATGNKFNFFQYFPFELNSYRRDNSKTLIRPISVSVATLLLVGINLLFALMTTMKGGAIQAAYIMFGISLIQGAIFSTLRFIKLSNYKLHLVFASIFAGMNILILVTYVFFFYNKDFFFFNNTPFGARLTILIVSSLLLIGEFILLLNPSYKKWNRMVKVDAETFARPKYSYLVMVEWGSFLIYILSFVPVLIATFF